MESTPSATNPLTHHTSLVCGTKFDVPLCYSIIKPIGHGSYGVVCAADWRDDNGNVRKVAIKKITNIFNNLIETKRTLREVKLLRFFTHANIIPIYDIFISPLNYSSFTDLYIVSELMNTDLHQIITSKQTLSDEHVQYFLYQILRGLKYIHSTHVIHRDLKPSNLLLNANCDLKICDFGLARQADPSGDSAGFLTEYVATRWYRAPEIMLSWKSYDEKMDIWSVGCIFAEILNRKPLFPGRDYMHQLHLIIETLGSPAIEDTEYIASDKAKTYIRSLPFRQRVDFAKLCPNVKNPQALDLLSKMLHFAPAKRISVTEALQHPYLALLHDPNDEPVCNRQFMFDFEDDVRAPQGQQTTKEQLRLQLWDEVCQLHPELRQQQPQSQ